MSSAHPFLSPDLPSVSLSTETSHSSEDSTLVVKLMHKGREVASTRRRLHTLEGENEELRAKLHCTVQCLQGASSELLTVQWDHSATSEFIHNQEEKCNAVKEENSTLKKCLNFYTKGTCKRKLEAKEWECSRVKDELQAAAAKNRHLQKERDHFRAQLRKMQLKHADLKRKLNRVKEKLKEERTRATGRTTGQCH